MATDPNEFDEILERFEKLDPEKRDELIDQLEQRQATTTNSEHADRTLLDGFKERGMVGSIKDAPADWSMNPRYMEGFGQDGE